MLAAPPSATTTTTAATANLGEPTTSASTTNAPPSTPYGDATAAAAAAVATVAHDTATAAAVASVAVRTAAAAAYWVTEAAVRAACLSSIATARAEAAAANAAAAAKIGEDRERDGEKRQDDSDLYRRYQESYVSLLQSHRVNLRDEDIPSALKGLRQLQDLLHTFPEGSEFVQSFLGSSTPPPPQSLPPAQAPGFFPSQSHETWIPVPTGFPYQVPLSFADSKVSDDKLLPLPSKDMIADCCNYMYDLFQERLTKHCSGGSGTAGGGSSNSNHQRCCCCIGQWEYVGGCVLEHLVHQGLEQLMTYEASRVLHGSVGADAWEDMYRATPASATATTSTTVDGIKDSEEKVAAAAVVAPFPKVVAPLRLLRNRDEFARAAVELSMAAERTVQISTCYLFMNDPPVRYVLFDLLPFCLRRNPDLKIEILVDLLALESDFLKCGLGGPRSTDSTRGDDARAITATSFLRGLPRDAPPYATDQPGNALHLLQQLLDLSRTFEGGGEDRYQIRYWVARDDVGKYRIKNHIKCIVFDDQAAIIGGSNFITTLKSATSELDMIVSGTPIVRNIRSVFRSLWDSMKLDATTTDIAYSADDVTTTGRVARVLEQERYKRNWTDDACRIRLVQSVPSIRGEDIIYRTVLDAIPSARNTVLISMGHSNYPRAMSDALVRAAVQHNVRIEILCNSKYSNDLRGGQRDLFYSLHYLLKRAESLGVSDNIGVYTTALKKGAEADPSQRPPFIHAKFVTIDGYWNAVGSWNLWTRGAFHEMEMEAFIESEQVARELANKFEQDKRYTVRVATSQECYDYLPTGCFICQGFGPFFENMDDPSNSEKLLENGDNVSSSSNNNNNNSNNTSSNDKENSNANAS